MDRPAEGDLDQQLVARAYAAWAPVYDIVCGPVLARGRRAAVRAVSNIGVGGRILEIGVGTGLALAHYPHDADIVGIDLSEPMLLRARKRLTARRHSHVSGLAIMDAHRLGFADCSFDCVVVPFVITLVAHPEGVLTECVRVTKPGGEIILVSHLYSEHGVAAAVERWFARRTAKLGLRPDFQFQRVVDWLAGQLDAELIERRKIPPFGIYTLVRIRRREPA